MEVKFAFLPFLLSSAIGEIINRPKNTEAFVGETTTLDCKVTDGPCEWLHYPIDTSSHQLVYEGGDIYNGYRGRFRVINNNGGACNLIISNVTLDDAGRYTCLEILEKGIEQKAAELIVFDVYPSNTSCSAKYICPPDCDTWEISCSMSYRGNFEPTMVWHTSEGNTIHSKSSTTSSGITTSAIIVQYDVENSYSYVCQVKYPSNSLESKYKWSFQRRARSSTSKENHGVTEPHQQPETISLTTLYVCIPVAAAIGAFVTFLVLCVVWKRNHCRNWVNNRRKHSSRPTKTEDVEEQVHLEDKGDKGESDEQVHLEDKGDKEESNEQGTNSSEQRRTEDETQQDKFGIRWRLEMMENQKDEFTLPRQRENGEVVDVNIANLEQS